MKTINIFKVSVLVLLSGIFQPLLGQNTDSLDLLTCLELAKKNAPVFNQFAINEQEWSLSQQTIGSTNLPTVSAYGKAWYQSDAITVTMPVPGMEGLTIDQFQYNLGLQVDQKLYDGGISKNSKELELAQYNLKQSKTETGLYQLNDIVVQLYFSSLLMKNTSKVLQIKIDNLQSKLKVFQSALDNGMITKSEFQKLEVEILNTKQKQDEILLGLNQVNNQLSILLGIDSENLILSEKNNISSIPEASRPELQMFDAQKQQFEAAKKLKSAQNRPHIAAYGQAGYSYPGLNFFENKDDYYYIVGAKMGWTIFDWSKTKDEKEILDVQQQKVSVQQLEFERNIQIESNSIRLEMDYLDGLLETDKEIIRRRGNITNSSSSALENGTITSTDYITDLNSEIASRVQYESHKIQLLQAEARLLIVTGIGIKTE